ncbi:hypothetical protein HD806DRAFT_538063 [Xylariaceae sp. AK1471]|nr:hypothetical protein HD806DRAFT_538063 [Xylariaceae sp. AK1471]
MELASHAKERLDVLNSEIETFPPLTCRSDSQPDDEIMELVKKLYDDTLRAAKGDLQRVVVAVDEFSFHLVRRPSRVRFDRVSYQRGARLGEAMVFGGFKAVA